MDDNLDNDSIRTEDYVTKFNEAIDLPSTQRTDPYQPIQSLCGDVKKSPSTATLLPTWCTLTKKEGQSDNHLNTQTNYAVNENTSEMQQNSLYANRNVGEENQIDSLTSYQVNSSLPSIQNNKINNLQPNNTPMNDFSGTSLNNLHSLSKQSTGTCHLVEKSSEAKRMNSSDYKVIRPNKTFNESQLESKLFPATCNTLTNFITTSNTTDQITSRKTQILSNNNHHQQHYYPPFRNRLPSELKQHEQYLDRSITSQSISLRGKCDNFKTDSSQYMESIQISGLTLTKDEIAAIINERDELYEILRANEEEASARYSTEKRLITMKQEFTAEQQRLRQIITALEEELEVTMCRLNQLTAERSKWTTEMTEIKNERDEVKEKLKNAEENHKTEISELKNEFEQKVRQIKLEETKKSEVITKEFEQRINSSLNEQMEKTLEFQQKIEKLNKTLKQVEEEKENLRLENVEITKEHRERERQIRCEYEEILENKSVEKGKEISKLMDVHSAQLNELIEQMQKEKIQAINDIRSCYTETVQELQNKLTDKQTEIQRLNETLTITQNQLQESRNQETLEKLKVQAVAAQSKELAEWEKEKFELWKIKMNELKDEKDACIETMKHELQEEKDLVKCYQDKLKTIQKEFDMYQNESERKITTLTNQTETLKIKHEMDTKEMQQFYNEKISNMEVKHTREIQQAIENELAIVHKQMQDKNQAEKDKLLEELTTLFSQITSKVGNLTTDIYQTLIIHIQNLYSASDLTFEADLEKQVMLSKEIELPNMTRKWIVNNTSIEGLIESLTKYLDEIINNLRMNSTNILTQIQLRKEVYLTRIKTELETAHNAAKRIQQQAESQHDEYKEKLKHYRARIEELEDDSTRSKLVEQLKLKEDEIECLRKEIQQFRQEMKQKAIEKSQTDHGEVIESQQPIRIIAELKARIQRLREENMALRRLLLRRPLLPVKQSDQESGRPPICRLPSGVQFSSKLKSKEDSTNILSKSFNLSQT
ncbi:unnamed protein product [Trichobilharzia szidati]|nr:unnamed protein product [Trichobilharzia szidati]